MLRAKDDGQDNATKIVFQFIMQVNSASIKVPQFVNFHDVHYTQCLTRSLWSHNFKQL